ncbi:MAG: hypothetical protein QMD77_03455 [Patescibacteria group bacterium]|nr:hypothetical protein [Patescibacteria group bacterium]
MNRNWKSKLREKAQRFFWHGYWTDPTVFFSFVPAVILNVIMWLAVWRIVQPTDQPLILHYNVYFGIDAIGDWRNIYLMPALALALLIANAVLSRFFYYKERLASYLFALMALVVQLLMAVGLASVIMINF